MEQSTPSPTVADPVVRSGIYHMLANGFKYPGQEIFARFQNGQFFDDLSESCAALPHLSDLIQETASIGEKVHEDLLDANFRDFEVSYVKTFDVGFPEPPCPPYEGFYNYRIPKTEVMLDVSAFYRHFGLAMSQEEGKRELPDYLPAELEFLHFLAFKESQAREEDDQELLKGYILAQKDFLERHMIDWLPKFVAKVHAEEGLPFYPRLALFAMRFISSDYEMVKALTKEQEVNQEDI